MSEHIHKAYDEVIEDLMKENNKLNKVLIGYKVSLFLLVIVLFVNVFL